MRLFASFLVRFVVLAWTAFAGLSAAGAEEVAVTVRTPDGAPLANAVITAPGDFPAGWTPEADSLVVAQEDLQFTPFVAAAPAGVEIGFPNRDRVRHHVYSFARGNRFELELYGRDQARSVRFETPGVVPLGCNIHDDMLAFIRIVETPHYAVTDAAGTARLTGLPAGPVTITVWHPYATAPDEMIRIQAEAGAGASAEATIEIENPF